MNPEKETYSNQRALAILEVIQSYARLDFQSKTEISDREDVFDAISAGVNMLGEELESSAISLKEKEYLLKEVHHRVKNNLQIISSLLNLQSEHIRDEAFLAQIRESKNRICSMALVHEMLYSTKNLSHINVHDYIVKLSDSLYETFYNKEKNIYIQLEIDSTLNFEIDEMIPLALILNEMITNSFKYAFPESEGIISIGLNRKNGSYLLHFTDNGIGIPEEINPKEAKSLGLQLIYMLSEQLGGELSLEGNPGTRFELKF